VTSLLPPDLDATIVLLRHGESAWIAEGRFQGQGDAPLSALGRQQAALAAGRLANPTRPPALPLPVGAPRAILTSPLSRTADTAAAVAAAMAAASSFGVRLEPEPDRGFLEIGQGEWEGLPAATIAERWGAVLDGWRRDPLTAWAPGGESLRAVDRRVRSSLGSLLARLRDAAPGPAAAGRTHVLGYRDAPSDEPWAIIVGHDGVFKVTLLALLDLPLARFWSFPFALAGISILEARRGRGRLRLHNAVEHLAPLEVVEPLEEGAARAREEDRGRTGAL
jgi:broad specificity phosphatase PhoE